MILVNLFLDLGLLILLIILTYSLFLRYIQTKETISLLLCCFFLFLCLASFFGSLSKIIVGLGGYETLSQWELNAYQTLGFPDSLILLQIVEMRFMLLFQALAYYIFYLFRLQSFSIKWHLGKYLIYMTVGTLSLTFIGFVNFSPLGDITDIISALLVFILALLNFPQFIFQLVRDRRKIKDMSLKKGFTSLTLFGLLILIGQGLFLLDLTLLFMMELSDLQIYYISWVISLATILFAYLGYNKPLKQAQESESAKSDIIPKNEIPASNFS